LKDKYHNVSLIYDQLMSGINYRFWAKYVYQLIRRYHKNRNSSVLELAAGNGNLTKFLYKKFKDYVVSDKSISMLKNFKVSQLHTICFDMLFPSVSKEFDVILCSFDSVNYILSKKKLKIFFNNISSLMKEDGIFLFDVGLVRNSLHHQKYASKSGSINDVKFSRVSIFLPKSKIHKNIFEFYFNDGTKRIEIHRQKIFELNELFDIIDQSNLYVVDCFNAFTFKDCKENNFRAQFVVKRKN